MVAADRDLRNTTQVSDKPVKRPLTPYGEPTDSLELERVTRVDDDELPVVARLVVEIRSDGSRTIARSQRRHARPSRPYTASDRSK